MLQFDTNANLLPSSESEGFFEIKNIANNNSTFEELDTSKEDIVSTNNDDSPIYNHTTDNNILTPTEGYLFNENYVPEEDILSQKQTLLFPKNNTIEDVETTSTQNFKSSENNSLEGQINTSKDEPIFDPDTYLQHLREMFNNKQQYMMEMVEILLLQIPEASKKMQEAISSENWDEMFFQSHRIKSTFKIVGLHELVNVCMAIEGRTRIIAPEELHLVPDFFKQFQILSKVEVPNLEKAFEYLKVKCEQERSKLPIEDSDSIFLL